MMKKIILLVLFALLCNITLLAQNITFKYSYDASGNRIKRAILIEVLEEEGEEAEEAIEPLILEQQEEIVELQTEENLNADAFLVQIYPNPSKGVYTLELPDLQEGEQGSIQIYGTTGQLVQEYRTVNRIQNINITGAMPGYYFLRVTVGGKLVAKTLIKQ